MWGPSMIGYGEYHYKYDSGREGDFMFATGFSPRKANLSIYILPGYAGLRADPSWTRLGKHSRWAKSCLYVSTSSPMLIWTCSSELIQFAGIDDLGAKKWPGHAQLEFAMDALADNTILIHTDGACSGNPGPGGWGAIPALERP
jgi:hypothetical protein